MKRVLLLLANGFEAVEASVFTDVIGWNKQLGDKTTELVTVGLKPNLTCTFNFIVTPEMLLENVNLNDFDALAIPGGFGTAGFYEDAYSEAFLEVIRHFNDRGKWIASICVAALPVAKSGALKGRTGTTYALGTGSRQKQLADLGVQVIPDQPIVVDGNIITSYNPATAFDVAFLLLEKLTSVDNAANVRYLMGFSNH